MNDYKLRPKQSYHEFVIREDWKKLRNSKYHEYRRLWSELPEKQIVSDFPLHLDIEITTLCNLQCPMCPRTQMIQKNQFLNYGIMKFDDFKNIIDQGAENGLYSIKLNYLGEPLVHPDIVKLVRYAKKKGIVDIMFNTNGVLLTEEMSTHLLEAGLDNLFLSFDSPYQKQYEQIRIGAKFEKVIKNIQYFSKLKKNKYPHVQERISMVMMTDDSKTREDFFCLFKDIADAVGFCESRDPYDKSKKPIVHGFVCSQLFQRMFLRLNGDVIVCCGDDKNGYTVGNWRNQRLRDIWHGEYYDTIRKAHKEGHYYSIPICNTCSMPVLQEKALNRKFEEEKLGKYN